MKDCYDILGVSTKADLDTIRTSYHELAKKLHPDVNPSPTAAERFKDVSAAYYVLSDPGRRGKHDRKLSSASNISNSRSGGSSSSAGNGQRRTSGSTTDDVSAGYTSRGSRSPSSGDGPFDNPFFTESGDDPFDNPFFTEPFRDPYQGIFPDGRSNNEEDDNGVPSRFSNIPANGPVATGRNRTRRQEPPRVPPNSVQANKVRDYTRRSTSNAPVISLTSNEALNGAVVPVDVDIDVQCNKCSGRGRSRWFLSCKTCGGNGVETTTSSLTIVTPSWLESGDVLRLQDRTKAGNPVFPGNKDPNLRVWLNVEVAK